MVGVVHTQPESIYFNHYGPSDGLTTRVTRAVRKTSDGVVWITSEDGLIRYDSERFYFFRHDPRDTTTISSNSCDQMVIDRHDHIWLVAGPYLDRLDPATGQFTHCYIQTDSGRIFNMAPESLHYDDARDQIWVGSAFGLFSVASNEERLTRAPLDPDGNRYRYEVFLDMTLDAYGALWLGSSQGFFKYIPETGTMSAFQIPHYSPGLNNNGVTTLFFDQKGQLWLGTWVKGLIRYDINTHTGTHFYYDPDTLRQQNGILAIRQSGLPDQSDILWLSAVHAGFTAFNMRTGKFMHYRTKQEGDPGGIMGQTNGLLPTQSEGMWVASENGLHRYDYAAQVFTWTDLSRWNPTLKTAAPIEFLTFMHATTGRDSMVWFHVPYLGLYQYNLKQDVLTGPLKALIPYTTNAVFGVYMDNENKLWISTGTYGLIAYDTRKGSIITLEGRPFSKPWTWVEDFYEDRQGRLWLGTFDGLFVMNEDKSKVIPVDTINRYMKVHHVASKISGITEDAAGRIWVTSSSQDVRPSLIAVIDEHLHAIIYTGIALDPILSAHETQLNDIACIGSSLYVATDYGLASFDVSGGPDKVQWITTREGLVNNRLRILESDNKGSLWCSSVFGVSRYHPASHTIINYTHLNSGLGNTMMPGIQVSPNTGLLYVCQQGGWNMENNVLTENVKVVPSILISDVKVGGVTYFAPDTYGNRKSPLHLTYNQNQLTVNFALPSFRNEEANRYAYRLKGHEDNWNQTLDGYVSFVGLAPGPYILQIKGADADGRWTQEEAELHFTIEPPIYQTWWFMSAVGIVISAVLFYIIRLRFQSLRQQYDLRNKIAGDLHDEIGSTLTSIHILSTVSRQALQVAPDQVREMLGQISTQSKAIQQNMSDIVWAIRPDNDKVENVVVRLREYAAQTLEPLNVQTHLYIDEQLVTKVLPLNARKELLLIAKEAINNVVKHSGATTVRITIQKKGQLFQFCVEDNGRWKGDISSTGTGRRSMQHRADALGGQLAYDIRSEGTQLTLEFPIT